MIIVYGAILLSTRLRLEPKPQIPHTHFANDYDMGIGGAAAIQALGACKTGEKTALVGHIGDDHYGKNILLRLRQHGVVTSGVARHERTPTGSTIEIGKGPAQTVIALGAGGHTNHEQIPEEILNESTVLLLSDDFPYAQNAPLLPKAKACGARVILSLCKRTDINEYPLEHLDYIVTHEAANLPANIQNKLIIVKNDGSCEAPDENGGRITIAPAAIEDRSPIDPTCAYDAFVGVFAAGLYQKRPLRESLTRAAITYTLTASKKGGYRTLPYPDEIREAMEAVQKP